MLAGFMLSFFSFLQVGYASAETVPNSSSVAPLDKAVLVRKDDSVFEIKNLGQEISIRECQRGWVSSAQPCELSPDISEIKIPKSVFMSNLKELINGELIDQIESGFRSKLLKYKLFNGGQYSGISLQIALNKAKGFLALLQKQNANSSQLKRASEQLGELENVSFVNATLESLVEQGLKGEKRSVWLESSQEDKSSVTLNFLISYLIKFPLPHDGGILGKFVAIKPGVFMMGEKKSDLGNEQPKFQVTLSREFEIMSTEVTQNMWRSVVGNNPSYFANPDHPVERVSWEDANEFANKLNTIQSVYSYSLPSEAQWEFAFGSEHYKLSRKEPEAGTTPAKSGPANSLGLFGMAGNVWEWTSDWYAPFSPSPKKDPRGPATGMSRVLRGCGWQSASSECEKGPRSFGHPGNKYTYVGFRLVRVKR